MSLSGISASNFFAGLSPSGVHNKFQQIQQDFQQLGQDLHTGNLSQAQSDFSSLQQLLPSQLQNGNSNTQSSSQSSNPVAQAFSQLSTDLKAGNLTAAQSDFPTLKQDLQLQQGPVTGHRHHHPHADASSSQQNSPATLFGELGQALQAGNLTAAQQTYSTLQQDFVQFAGGNGGAGGSSAGSTSLNLSA